MKIISAGGQFSNAHMTFLNIIKNNKDKETILNFIQKLFEITIKSLNEEGLL